MKRVIIASSNPGKLRDFRAVASLHGVEIELLPNFESVPEAVEDGTTFEANARKKAVHYSRFAPSKVVLADDSGLAVDFLHGEPGVHSARYAATSENGNADDEANNQLLLKNLDGVGDQHRTARFVCVISIARDGEWIESFRGETEGRVLTSARGTGGFGYDPLFYFPALCKTFAELSAEEKGRVSHRGKAFQKFLEWCDRQAEI